MVSAGAKVKKKKGGETKHEQCWKAPSCEQTETQEKLDVVSVFFLMVLKYHMGGLCYDDKNDKDDSDDDDANYGNGDRNNNGYDECLQ